MVNVQSDNFIRAYSEFMPAPRIDYPYRLIPAKVPRIWQVSEVEEEYELRPGLKNLARQIMDQIVELGRGGPAYFIAGHRRRNLRGNPYWPPELAGQAGNLFHERFTMFLALSLSRTQDDKGRVRWTFFGSSEQGPEKAFWRSFFDANSREIPFPSVIRFWRSFFKQVYDIEINSASELSKVGFRILPSEANPRFPYWREDRLPSWVNRFLFSSSASTRYLLTFRPFDSLPEPVRKMYLAGRLCIIPFPGSLVFWGMPAYLDLQVEMAMAMQLPLLRVIKRHNGGDGIKVPQSGWFHEEGAGRKIPAVSNRLLVNSYKRTHRWDRLHRYEDELATTGIEDTIGRTLFSTDLETLGLYSKPMARNSQLWTMDSHLLLDGPSASVKDLKNAAAKVAQGGSFHYRFQFPAMRLGTHEIYWQRPLCAFQSDSDKVELLDLPLAGYLTAYQITKPDLEAPVEIHPRIPGRKLYLAALRNFEHLEEHYRHQNALNIIRLLDAYSLKGESKLSESLARVIIELPEHTSVAEWLTELPQRAANKERGEKLLGKLSRCIDLKSDIKEPDDFTTFGYTKERAFEEAWWNDVKFLAAGKYLNKNNADCVRDPATQAALKHHRRDLDRLGDYVLDRHRQSVTAAKMEGRAFCGELRFKWLTDFEYPEFGGWGKNREGYNAERDLVVVIPGKNRNNAVIMADHFDTAFMEDVYDKARGGSGARLASPGADDNHSATATLLQAAPVFLDLSRRGVLESDIWLVHLTGEEFPADCLGSRNMAQALIRRDLHISNRGGKTVDLSGVNIIGIFVLDMISHNADFGRDIFQIAPGRGPESFRLAEIAHRTNEQWNAATHAWNKRLPRRGKNRSTHSPDGTRIPPIAEHAALTGEVRLIENPHSSLYNTDGQIFSDSGLPVVLFMENYDINRSGYHDTRDTMANIDLDYGAALASIAIETVARTANTIV